MSTHMATKWRIKTHYSFFKRSEICLGDLILVLGLVHRCLAFVFLAVFLFIFAVTAEIAEVVTFVLAMVEVEVIEVVIREEVVASPLMVMIHTASNGFSFVICGVLVNVGGTDVHLNMLPVSTFILGCLYSSMWSNTIFDIFLCSFDNSRLPFPPNLEKFSNLFTH